MPSFESFAGEAGQAATPAAPDEIPQADQFEWNSVSEQRPLDPSSSFADLSENSTVGYGVESTVGGFESTNVALDESLSSLPTGDKTRVEALLRQELESVDFYMTQGYTDIAIDTLDLMERQFGSNPEIDVRREKLKAGPPVEVTVASAPTPGASAEGSSVNVDLAFGAAGQAEAGSKASASASGVKGIDPGLAEIFEEFREAAEEEPISNEDYETHYNMGTAYKEMELIDEAIHEFQTAANLSKPGDGTSRYLQCCNMLGHCFLDKGMPRAAVLWFKKGLESPGHGEEEYKALRYELGSAYQQMGDFNRALEIFTEVYGIDVSYRDVADKLQELQAQKKAGKKKRK